MRKIALRVISVLVAVVAAACRPAPTAPPPARPPAEQAPPQPATATSPGTFEAVPPAQPPPTFQATEAAAPAEREPAPPGVDPDDCNTGSMKSQVGTNPLPASMTSCKANSECVLVSETCCPCGAGPRPQTAVNVRSVDAHRRRVCGPPPGAPCPGCKAGPKPHLIASCVTGRCAVVDLGQTELTQCSSDEDCRLRTKDCCECGASTSIDNFATVRADRESDFAAYRCDASTICRQCAPTSPSQGRVRCKCNRCVFDL
jgi:hypothetical protein